MDNCPVSEYEISIKKNFYKMRYELSRAYFWEFDSLKDFQLLQVIAH